VAHAARVDDRDCLDGDRLSGLALFVAWVKKAGSLRPSLSKQAIERRMKSIPYDI
jgi:hypothetical protein